jgi:hypothetical protein
MALVVDRHPVFPSADGRLVPLVPADPFGRAHACRAIDAIGGAARMTARAVTPELQRIKRKLDAWELEHLRALAAELAERLEYAEAACARAEEAADFWREQVQRIEDVQLGIDQTGNLHVLGCEAQ